MVADEGTGVLGVGGVDVHVDGCDSVSLISLRLRRGEVMYRNAHA